MTSTTIAAPPAWDAPLAAYEAQAEQLLAGHAAGVPQALQLLHETLPRFLDDTVTWLPRPLSPEQIRDTAITLDEARLAVARRYSFRDWESLATLTAEVARETSPVRRFEHAVHAVITGDAATLQELLRAHPDLVRHRSTRVTCHDPPVHGAMLLHYLGANGVEGYRQRSPPNAVDIARLVLQAGAEADALAGMYGGESPTLSMLVSSTPPAVAGVQVPLVHVLLDHGADVEGVGHGAWRSPLLTALVFGFRDAAAALVARGALVDDLVKAAGLGRAEQMAAMLPAAASDERHRAFALAAINGHLEAVRLLLVAGEDPNRLNPPGFHAHATPLHQAALAGHLPLVQLLTAHGARTDISDTLWRGTALGWAEHGEQTAVADYLRGLEADGGTR
ncbi:MAG: ankyrin repeat domain-containing protein [Gemmatimonadaceae bacterium]|nr:ankyrin repeat domain-containing protein [Gemmatimonadaceae bacterium]